MAHKTDIEIAREARRSRSWRSAPNLAFRMNISCPMAMTRRRSARISSPHSRAAQRQTRPGHRDQPDPAGEGKTTTTVGLGDGLNRIGKKAVICIREASLGPNFGMKGGAAGGGYAQVVPMEDMNLHFTGDFHAITSAHNLLTAMIDNHIYWGNALEIDTRRVAWRRVLDMNDRALRQVNVSLGGVANGFPRESGFDITVASEVMAILCLAKDLAGPGKAPWRHDRRLSP